MNKILFTTIVLFITTLIFNVQYEPYNNYYPWYINPNYWHLRFNYAGPYQHNTRDNIYGRQLYPYMRGYSYYW